MTDSATSPFVLLRTVHGLVDVDVRTIAGNITHAPDGHERIYLRSTITDTTLLHFATAEEADAAVTLLHAAREQHDDARAEDARAKVVGEAIRESGKEFTREVAAAFSEVVATFSKFGFGPVAQHEGRASDSHASSHAAEQAPRDATLPQVEALRKFLHENGYVTWKSDVKTSGLVQLHLTCGVVVSLYTATGTAVVQGKPSDADRKAIIELLRVDEWKV